MFYTHTDCVLQVSTETEEILPVIREIAEKGQDGPSGKLNSPVGIASCGNAIYIAEHPTDIQGLIRIYHSLEGLIRFQQICNKVSKAFGMISKREFRQQSKEENERTKVRKLFEAVPELEEPCRDLKGLIETVSGL